MHKNADHYPTMHCPSCGHEESDLDGLGVLHCAACGWCSHAALSGNDGRWVCDFCGTDVGQAGEPLEKA